jgi:quercetin dioxygenase-like cupin family protein
MPDHSYDDLTLDRFWDDLVDSSDADTQWVDPERAAVVRKINTLAQAPVPASARDRVRQWLLSSHESPTFVMEAPTSAGELEEVVAPRPSVYMHVLTRLPDRPVMRYAALAALLLLVLGGIFGSSRLLDRLRGGDPAMIPAAILDTATPSTPDATDEILLDVTLSADAFPAADVLYTKLEAFSVPPGTTSSWPATYACCPDPHILYILNGSLTVTADGPVRVIRTGGQSESVPADTRITLGPDDAIAPSPDTGFEFSNSSTAPVNLLVWVLTDPNLSHSFVPMNWISLGYSGDGRHVSAPNGSVRLLLRDVTLAGGARTKPLPDSSYQLFLPKDRANSLLGENSDFTIINKRDDPVTLYVVTLLPASEIVQAQTLLNAVLPEDQLQTPGRFNSIMGYYAVPAGSRDAWSGPTDNAPEPLVWYVLSGSYTVRAEQELQIARAGGNGKTTVVAAGAEITLSPGDTLVRPAHAAMQLANSGPEPVHLVVWTLGDINLQGPSLPPNWDSLPCYPGETSGKAPTGPVRLKLRLVTLPPESTLSAPPGAYVQQVLDLTQKAPNIGQKSDYSLVNQGSEPATLYVVSLEPAGSGSAATPPST